MRNNGELSVELARETLRHFREWFADHFEDFDSETNAQLLCLDNEAAAALGEQE